MSKRVIFATNDCGYRFLKVAVYSLVTHVDPSGGYEICVLEGEGGVSAENKSDLERVVSGRFPVRWIDVDPYLDAHRSELLTINKGRTLMIWARVFCGDVFGDSDENMLYLDTDVLVAGDLGEIFDTDLGTDLVGMVPEDGRGERLRGRLFDREYMPSGAMVYCNAGMMLFNPAAWRRENVGARLLAWGLGCPQVNLLDQDAVNVVLWNRIRVLPTKWNYHDGWVERSLKLSVRDRVWLGNDPLDVLEAIRSPRILHYWGARKPWMFNHRPERLRYERAMRDLGMVDGRLEDTTFFRRVGLPFWDGLHGLIKAFDRMRLNRLRKKRDAVGGKSGSRGK